MTELSAVRAEIVRLHDFFEAWFNGVEGLSLAAFSNALDPQFYMVAPSGAKLSKAAVVNGVATQFGEDSSQISIHNVEIEYSDGSAVTATYEEHQVRGGVGSARITTVTMVTDRNAPGGYRWLFVHETWL